MVVTAMNYYAPGTILCAHGLLILETAPYGCYDHPQTMAR